MGNGIISIYVVAITIAWLGSHLVKYAVSLLNNEKHSLRSHLFRSGGMPSAHSATVVSLTTIIGLKDGIGSAVFSLSLLFAMIVMYDAMKVRRSAGEQGEAINSLIKEQKSTVKPPRSAKGHSPIEVVAGACFGLVIGVVVFLATK